MTTRAKSSSSRPLIRTDGTIPWPPSCSISETIPNEPSSFTEANKFPEWRLAMTAEFNALLQTQTWTLVPPSPSINTLGVRWVYKTKLRSDGSIERRKARLVAKGFNQLQGIDYTETFSPVAKPTTIRLLLSLAASKKWIVRQLDIQNAFLHGELTEDDYISQPQGFTHSQFPNFVCKLKKSLYGLKQAPRAWFPKLSDTLVRLGFTPSTADTSLFVFNDGRQLVFILVYVDDLLVISSTASQAERFMASLSTHFPVKRVIRYLNATAS